MSFLCLGPGPEQSRHGSPLTPYSTTGEPDRSRSEAVDGWSQAKIRQPNPTLHLLSLSAFAIHRDAWLTVGFESKKQMR